MRRQSNSLSRRKVFQIWTGPHEKVSFCLISLGNTPVPSIKVKIIEKTGRVTTQFRTDIVIDIKHREIKIEQHSGWQRHTENIASAAGSVHRDDSLRRSPNPSDSWLYRSSLLILMNATTFVEVLLLLLFGTRRHRNSRTVHYLCFIIAIIRSTGSKE